MFVCVCLCCACKLPPDSESEHNKHALNLLETRVGLADKFVSCHIILLPLLLRFCLLSVPISMEANEFPCSIVDISQESRDGTRYAI